VGEQRFSKTPEKIRAGLDSKHGVFVCDLQPIRQGICCQLRQPLSYIPEIIIHDI
jgi:hypothetical protein